MSEFKYIDAVKHVVIAANARIPRLQPSAIREIADMTSAGVHRGDWVQIGDDVSTADGMTPEGYVDFVVSTRPHMEVAPEVIEATDDTWLSGSLTKQGERYNAIRAVFQKGEAGDALAKAALAAEAALYGTTPGSTKPGGAPGSKPEAVDTGTGPRLAVSTQASDNPWNKSGWHGTEEMRQAKIQSIIKTSTAMAAGMAKSAGVTLSGQPLRPVKPF
jgi:hypothetical protein